jgi:phosphatidylserine synthase
MSPLNAILVQMRLFIAFDLLNSRELATIIWIVLIFLALLFIRPVRADLAKVGRTLVGPPLLETFVVLVVYVVLLAWTGHALGIWTTDLISETVWWFVGTALVLVFNVTTG